MKEREKKEFLDIKNIIKSVTPWYNKQQSRKRRILNIAGSIVGIVLLFYLIWHFSGEWRFHIDISDWPKWILPGSDKLIVEYWNGTKKNEKDINNWLDFYDNGMVVLVTSASGTWSRVLLGKLSYKDITYIKGNVKNGMNENMRIWESVRYEGGNIYTDMDKYYGTIFYELQRDSLEQITDVIPYKCSIKADSILLSDLSFDDYLVQGEYPELGAFTANTYTISVWQRTRETRFFKTYYREILDKEYPEYKSLLECLALNELVPEWYEMLQKRSRLDRVD